MGFFSHFGILLVKNCPNTAENPRTFTFAIGTCTYLPPFKLCLIVPPGLNFKCGLFSILSFSIFGCPATYYGMFSVQRLLKWSHMPWQRGNDHLLFRCSLALERKVHHASHRDFNSGFMLNFMFKTKIMRPWKQKLSMECGNVISNTLIKCFWKIFCQFLVLFITCMRVDLDGYVFIVSHQTRKQWCTQKSHRRQEESCPGQECQDTQSPGPKGGSSCSTPSYDERFSAKWVSMTDKIQVKHIAAYKGFQQQATKIYERDP